MSRTWRKAAGSGGYNVDGPVYGRTYRHRVMFTWRNKEKNFWTVSIPGLMSCGGDSIEEATKSAERHIDNSVSSDYDSFTSPDKFKEIMADTKVLGFIDSSVPSKLYNEDDGEENVVSPSP